MLEGYCSVLCFNNNTYRWYLFVCVFVNYLHVILKLRSWLQQHYCVRYSVDGCSSCRQMSDEIKFLYNIITAQRVLINYMIKTSYMSVIVSLLALAQKI